MLRITGTLGGSARPPGGFFIARSELKPAVTELNSVTRQSCPLCGRLAGPFDELRTGIFHLFALPPECFAFAPLRSAKSWSRE